jgi:hypothetical protein
LDFKAKVISSFTAAVTVWAGSVYALPVVGVFETAIVGGVDTVEVVGGIVLIIVADVVVELGGKVGAVLAGVVVVLAVVDEQPAANAANMIRLPARTFWILFT